MPYTISHIAAVMPGYRPLSRAHILSAAVIGSMVPDFGLLLPRDPARVETHSFAALFTFCLPVGLLAYWLTQLLIKPAVLEVLPDGPYLRLRSAHPAASLAHLKNWFTVSAAILFGALTHIIWDSFTHENTRQDLVSSYLKDHGPVVIRGHHVAVNSLLQWGSSAVGLMIVLIALTVWVYHAQSPQSPPLRRIAAAERLLWICLYLMPPVLAVSWAIWRANATGISAFDGLHGLGSAAIASVRGAVVSLLFISALLQIRCARA